MKIEKEQKFTPIIITLENPKEVRVFKLIFGWAGTVATALEGVDSTVKREEIVEVLNSNRFNY